MIRIANAVMVFALARDVKRVNPASAIVIVPAVRKSAAVVNNQYFSISPTYPAPYKYPADITTINELAHRNERSKRR